MIRGVGLDAVEIRRIEETIARWGERFLKKIFTQHEIEYCSSKKSPSQHFAVRFAAKEAFSKAIATGWTGIFEWRNVEVSNAPSGRPEIQTKGKLSDELSHSRIHLSLTHTETMAVAVVVIETIEN